MCSQATSVVWRATPLAGSISAFLYWCASFVINGLGLSTRIIHPLRIPRILRRDPILGSTHGIHQWGHWLHRSSGLLDKTVLAIPEHAGRVELGSEIIVYFLNPNISGFGYHLRNLWWVFGTGYPSSHLSLTDWTNRVPVSFIFFAQP